MLKTISLYNLIALLAVVLVSMPVLVLTSHDHLFSAGDGCHSIQSHTCNTKELHGDLHTGDTCVACLRAGCFVALAPADQSATIIIPVGATTLAANPQLTVSDDLACPERGPPTVVL